MTHLGETAYGCGMNVIRWGKCHDSLAGNGFGLGEVPLLET